MSDAIIKVEGLGKKFIISHEQQRRTYTAFRDVVAEKAKAILKKRKTLPVREEFWALKDLNFQIKKGEAVGIIGRNGAGKSTLLKILSRITEPSTGRIELYGRMSSLLEVGTGFHPELTGRENIFLNGAILGMTRMEIRKKFDEIVDFSGVEKFLDTPVKHYSSGMYVRLAFAVAAHLEPEILVVDEVLAVGDAEFQRKCLGKMNEVSRADGRTVLFVSHNMGAIVQICSSAILLTGGQIKHFGDAQETVGYYLQNEENLKVYEGKCDKELFVSRVETLDAESNNNNKFRHDQDVFIKVKTVGSVNNQDVRMLISVKNKLDQIVFSAETVHNKAIFTLKISKNFLVRGTYSLRVILYNPGSAIFDSVEHCCYFEIIDGGSEFAHLNSFDYGTVFGNYVWE